LSLRRQGFQRRKPASPAASDTRGGSSKAIEPAGGTRSMLPSAVGMHRATQPLRQRPPAFPTKFLLVMTTGARGSAKPRADIDGSVPSPERRATRPQTARPLAQMISTPGDASVPGLASLSVKPTRRDRVTGSRPYSALIDYSAGIIVWTMLPRPCMPGCTDSIRPRIGARFAPRDSFSTRATTSRSPWHDRGARRICRWRSPEPADLQPWPSERLLFLKVLNMELATSSSSM
jgi:hypothetical protein